MIPMTATPTEQVWGDKKFLPGYFDPQRVESKWQRAVWARFIDMKPVSFQPKEGISLGVALSHLKAVMNCEGVEKGRRYLAASYLCSEWFESFEESA
jgi:hypothetical protein